MFQMCVPQSIFLEQISLLKDQLHLLRGEFISLQYSTIETLKWFSDEIQKFIRLKNLH